MPQIVENRLASKYWIVLNPEDEVRTGAVHVLRQSAALNANLNHSLTNAVSCRNRVAKDKLLPSPAYYNVVSQFKALTREFSGC